MDGGFHRNANNNPRREAGFICPETPARDREFGARVGKRVNGFEPSTFTLATCSHTDLTASAEAISCGDSKGVTNTVTTGVQEAWPTLSEDLKQSILGLLGD